MMVLNLFLLMLLLCLLMGVKLEMYRLAAARAVQVPLLILVVQEVMEPVPTLQVVGEAARLDMRVTAVTAVMALAEAGVTLVVLEVAAEAEAAVAVDMKTVRGTSITPTVVTVAVFPILVKAQAARAVHPLMLGNKEVPVVAMVAKVRAALAAGITKNHTAAITTCIERRVTPVLTGLYVLFGRAQTIHLVHTHQQTQVTCNETIYPN
jgi:hypothetical protein